MIHFFKTLEKSDYKMLSRLLFFLISWINQILLYFDYKVLNITESDLYYFISITATFVSSLYMLWKNNNFTKKARGKQ